MNFIKMTSEQIQQEVINRLKAGETLIRIANSCYPEYYVLRTEWHENMNGIEMKFTRFMIADTKKNALVINKLFNTAQQAKIALNTEVLHKLLEVCFVDTNKMLPEFLQVMREQVELNPEYLNIEGYILDQIENSSDLDTSLLVMDNKGKIKVCILPYF